MINSFNQPLGSNPINQQQNSQENESAADLTQDFLTLDNSEFLEKAGSLRKVPVLTLSPDLSSIGDKEQFIKYVRLLKAFFENQRSGQEKRVTVKIREEQMSWEPNALQCGFKVEKV
jgi:hypothetical protein